MTLRIRAGYAFTLKIMISIKTLEPKMEIKFVKIGER